MRTLLTLLIAVLFVGSPARVASQATPSTTGAPEVFTATATAKSAAASVSGRLEVRVGRYTPEFDRKTVEEALRLGGYPRFVTALRSAPEVGELVLGEGKPYAIRYARETIEPTGRAIVVITDRPVLFLGGGQADAKPRAGYEVALVRIQLDGTGQAQGTMVAAARVRPAGDGDVLLDDYADEPITLTDVKRTSP